MSTFTELTYCGSCGPRGCFCDWADEYAAKQEAKRVAIEEADAMARFLAETNGRYRSNLSDPYRAYSNKRVIVLTWNSTSALIKRGPNEPAVMVARSHLVIE